MAVAVRRCALDDWPLLKSARLAALRDAPTAFGMRHADVCLFSDDQWRARASGAAGAQYFLAVREGEAVGMAGGAIDAEDNFNLIGMWVRADARGQGLARRLLDCVTTLAGDQGHARVVLSVAPDNPAVRIYRAHGFDFIERWEQLASHPQIRVQWMEWLAPDRVRNPA